MRVPDYLMPNFHHGFICGIGRSGTSILHAMLGAHPRVEALPETGFLTRHVLRNDQPRSPSEMRALLANDKRIARWGVPLEEIVAGVFRRQDWAMMRDVYTHITDLRGRSESTQFVLDKDPGLIEDLPLLADMFPSARIIIMQRDARDIIVSRMNAAWSADRRFLDHLLRISYQQRLGTLAQRTLTSNISIVSYEQLVGDPPGTLGGLCNLLPIGFEPAMLSHEASASRLAAEDEMQWKKETLQPISKKSVGQYKRGLTPYQIGATETSMGILETQNSSQSLLYSMGRGFGRVLGCFSGLGVCVSFAVKRVGTRRAWLR